jgi:thiamine transport system substrate-binding protein
VALVKGGKSREAAGQFIEFLRSATVQQQLQTEMWMYPAEAGVVRADVMQHAPEPAGFTTPSDQEIADKGAAWVQRWTKVVLK